MRKHAVVPIGSVEYRGFLSEYQTNIDVPLPKLAESPAAQLCLKHQPKFSMLDFSMTRDDSERGEHKPECEKMASLFSHSARRILNQIRRFLA